jgi:segregation and condensation protein B
MQQRPILEPADEALVSAVESLLLVAGGPVQVTALARVLETRPARIYAALQRLRESLRGGIRLQMSGGAAQLTTAPENASIVQRFAGTEKPAPLSRSALEALTVIAYRQPVTRGEIEAVRGVNSDRAVQTLLARGLIEERGHRESPGRPIEYVTTFGFLEYFGLGSIDDLPPLTLEMEDETQPASLGMRQRDTSETE